MRGGDRDSNFVPLLRRKGLLKEIPHRSSVDISTKKSTIVNEYLANFLTSQQHQKKVSEIVTTLFPISDSAALEAIKDSAERNITHDEFLSFQMSENHHNIKNAITENYMRTILYLDIAASYGLNYSPDTFRIPIVEYVNSSINETINPYIKKTLVY